MKIIIAHPKSSFIEAITQMLSEMDNNYTIVSATTLATFVEKIASSSFDIAILDSDLANHNHPAFLKILDTLKDESSIILLGQAQEKELLEKSKQAGVEHIILKESGYLSTLATQLSKLVTRIPSLTEESSPVVNPTANLGHKLSENDKKTPGKKATVVQGGYFVCDRRGRFLSVNNVLESISRYSVRELLQLSIVDLIAENEDSTTVLRRIFDSALHGKQSEMAVPLVDKYGERHLCKLVLRVLRDDSLGGQNIGFRGTFYLIEPESRNLQKLPVDQNTMISELVNLVHDGYSDPLNIFLRRIIEVVCQVFKFKRSTIALLDRRKQAFMKQAMIGYTQDEGQTIEQRALQVPREVIDRIFGDRFRIKVIYFNQDQRELPHEDNPGVPERRTQRRRPLNEWHRRDLILINLIDFKGNSFGYISLDEPLENVVPTRSTFHNLELFSRLVSMAIENYYRFNVLGKKNRRLKQILANSNIFKLHLSLTDLLLEMVWSAKNTLEFNHISLLLINRKTQLLETKAVACDDKIKQVQIRELTYDVNEFSDLLRDDYQTGKSYLINREEPVLDHLKQIYYGSNSRVQVNDGWPNWAVLLVPIRGRDGKIIGFFLADDPYDMRIPSPESIHTLEILANQIAVAIDNRIMFVQAKDKIERSETKVLESELEGDHQESVLDLSITTDSELDNEDISKSGLKKLVERFLR